MSDNEEFVDFSPGVADHEGIMDDHAAVHLIIISLLFLVIVNLFLLDLKLFSPSAAVRVAEMQTVAPPPTVQPANGHDSCGTECQRIIAQKVQEAVASLATPSPRPVTQAAVATIREFYVPLGSGFTTQSSWENLTATDTWIDTSSYGKISEVTFIAGLRNPTKNGTVEAQLYNVTDNHPVWGSLVIMSNAQSETLTSGPIQLDTGTKLYRVQLKSTLGYEAFLDTGKLRLLSR